MSYEAVYASLERCKQAAAENRLDHESLIEAVEQLVVVLQSDLAQIKVAVGHTASLLEKND